jgi:hypothetical protein
MYTYVYEYNYEYMDYLLAYVSFEVKMCLMDCFECNTAVLY